MMYFSKSGFTFSWHRQEKTAVFLMQLKRFIIASLYEQMVAWKGGNYYSPIFHHMTWKALHPTFTTYCCCQKVFYIAEDRGPWGLILKAGLGEVKSSQTESFSFKARESCSLKNDTDDGSINKWCPNLWPLTAYG